MLTFLTTTPWQWKESRMKVCKSDRGHHNDDCIFIDASFLFCCTPDTIHYVYPWSSFPLIIIIKLYLSTALLVRALNYIPNCIHLFYTGAPIYSFSLPLPCCNSLQPEKSFLFWLHNQHHHHQYENCLIIFCCLVAPTPIVFFRSSFFHKKTVRFLWDLK